MEQDNVCKILSTLPNCTAFIMRLKFYMNKSGDILKDTLGRKETSVRKVLSIRFKPQALKWAAAKAMEEMSQLWASTGPHCGVPLGY